MNEKERMNPFARRCAFVTLVATVALLPFCMTSLDPGTSGSETGNGWITGAIVDTAGRPLSHVQVTLLRDGYDPCRDSVPYRLDTTDDSGAYAFVRIKEGTYTLQSVHLVERTRALRVGVRNEGDMICIPADTLRKPGSIRITPPGGVDVLFGYLYIPGSTIFAFMNNSNSPVMLDSVPSGMIDEIRYSSKATQEATVVTRDIQVQPGDTVVITNTEWRFSQKLFLNTSASGANVMGAVTDFPLLVRLSRDDFSFSQAKSDGSDIRFVHMSGDPLNYEIERWDPVTGRAEVWVRVDTIKGNNTSQYITMYWGNSDAPDLSSGILVFDTDRGFQGVWHLNTSPVAGSYSISDNTANRNNGIPRNNLTAVDFIEGIIGGAFNFDGPAGSGGDWIQIPNSGTLEYAGTLAVSAWFRVLDVNCGCDQGIFSKYIETSSVMRGYALNYYKNQRLMFVAGTGTILYYIFSDNVIIDNDWHHVVGGVNSDSLFMYVDGKKQSATIKAVPVSSNSVAGIGITATNVDGLHFVGDIDEVRFDQKERTADWVKLSYMNQRKDDRLVVHSR
jgi:hypothetical protein